MTVVSRVRKSYFFSPPRSFKKITCIASNSALMNSCESSCRPRLNCLATLLMSFVNLPMLCASLDAIARSKCCEYSHTTQNFLVSAHRATS